MTERMEETLTKSEFAQLLAAHKLTPEDRSPVQGMDGRKPARSMVVKFRERGWMEPAWHDALDALCKPTVRLSCATAYSDRVIAPSFAGSKQAPKHLVGFSPDGEGIALSFPWTAKEIAINDCVTLSVDTAPYPDVGPYEFTTHGLATLAAAADAVRSVLLASVLHRQVVDDFVLPRNHLELMRGMSEDDANFDMRWLVTLFRALAPSPFRGEKVNLKSGFSELVELGLVQTEGRSKWSPTETLVNLAGHWMTPVPAIAHEAIMMDGTSETVSHSLTLRGSGPLCLIQFENETRKSAKATLRSLEPNAYWLELFAMFTPSVPERQAPAESADAVACPECGAAIQPGARFCTECGARMKDSAKPAVSDTATCNQCGAPINAGQKFCTGCGAKIG